MRTLFALFFILALPLHSAMAYSYSSYSDDKTISLYDLGVLQLAAHDLFFVDRDAEIDNENGLLDLSTLFDYGEEAIAIGGEFRNRENIMLFSGASAYGKSYNRLVSRGVSEERARAYTVRRFHADLSTSYRRAFGHSLPRPKSGDVTKTENLALRTIHDYLPGEIVRRGEIVSPIDNDLHDKTLSRSEMKQPSDPLDGEFHPVFLDIHVVIPPDIVIIVNLLEADSNFSDQFDTDFSFEHFLSELEDGEYDKNDDVMKLIESLFAKGLNI